MSGSTRRPDLHPDNPLYYAPRRIREGTTELSTSHAPPDDNNEQALADLLHEETFYRDARALAIADRNELASQQSRLADLDEFEDLDESEIRPRLRPRIRLFRVMAPIAAAAGLVAGGFIFYTRTAPTTLRFEMPASDPPQIRETPMLRAEDSNGTINESLPLGIKITAPAPGATVHLTGMLQGTRLTTGVAAASGAWRIAVNDLPIAMVVPPRDYAGPMTIFAELHAADDRIIFSDSVHLNWAPPISKSSDAAGLQQPAGPSAASKPAEDIARKMPPNELLALIKRGEELASSGDLPAARLLLQRAAETHNPHAALALATTYDPIMMERFSATSSAADVALAQTWYQKARDWGAAEAAGRLEALATRHR